MSVKGENEYGKGRHRVLDVAGRLFDRYFGGDTDYEMPSGKITLEVWRQCAELLREAHEKTGALVVGRGHFDLARGWGGRHPIDVPVFVVTHAVPEVRVHEGSPFTFVTEGVEVAFEKAKVVTGDKDVGVGGANVAQQAIRAGLVDEMSIDLVPVLLGEASGSSAILVASRSSWSVRR